jgi:aminoglycoside phosphotransferase (APT) family kinase protein
MIASAWVDGDSLDHLDVHGSDAASLGAEVGEALSLLHSVRVAHADWRKSADARFRRKLNSAFEQHHVSDELMVSLRDSWAGWSAFLDDAPVTLVHRDLNADNLIRTPTGVAFIDLEQVRVADPLYDFVKLCRWMAGSRTAWNGFRATYPVPAMSEATKSRMLATIVLEHLSAIVYFDKRGNSPMVDRERASLLQLLNPAHREGPGPDAWLFE